MKRDKGASHGMLRLCGTESTPPPDPVLVVDDDRLLLQAITIGLESHGYRTVTACNGTEALDVMRRENPCLVLLDLEMPDLNGWQFREQLRADARLAAVPVVLLSSRTDADRQARTMDLAAGLQKPIDLDVLYATVTAQCRRHN